MQRWCARIAGLRTFACRSTCEGSLKTLVRPRPFSYYSRDTQHVQRGTSSSQDKQHVQDGTSHSQVIKDISPGRGTQNTKDIKDISPSQDAKDTKDTQENVKEEGFERLIGADKDRFDRFDRFDKLNSGLKRPSRQASIRQAKALHKDGFAYIDSSKLPARDVSHREKAWMPTIEAALPPRLRNRSAAQITLQPYSPQDISRIIHISSYTYGLDLLTYLAVARGRPKAAVWLASLAIAHDFVPESTTCHGNVWNTSLQDEASLTDFTEQPNRFRLEPPSIGHTHDPLPTPTLDQLTAELHPHEEPLPSILRHDTIGQIWYSLATMILKDAARANKDPSNQAIKPEILEIIAMLHHTGAMPSSIYSYQPPDDPISLCQPPTLHLLSNQIITSLTDAAWRAHETNVVEEAKERGGVYKSLRPEIPGSMYKVHVTGLGHEIWLELVLWACLYGRFYKQGTQILLDMSRQKDEDAWSVLSWRELANPIIQSGQEKSINWDEVKYIFNTGIADTDQTVNKKKVRRTVSAEIIASFVDATASHVSAGVGSRGVTPEDSSRFFTWIKKFLGRNNMSLGYTSWDAMILRFYEARGIDFDKDPRLARNVNLISSKFGDDIATVNAPTRDQLWQPTPAYVLDGSAATIGYHHRLLRAHIKLGSLSGATGVLSDLQKLTDMNKERSIREFLDKQQDVAAQDDVDDDASEFDFEDGNDGIHYPGLHFQIPVPLLADFLDLVVDSNALELGSWLIYSNDLDGPIIHRGLYSDPLMGPPLVRLAASLGDKDLMSKVFDQQRRQLRTDIPKQVLTALMNQQIEAANWPFVERALDNFAQLPGYSISTNTTATLVRMILREAKSCSGDLAELANSASSRAFKKMNSFRASDIDRGYVSLQDTVNTELGRRTWHLLALVNDDWREYAWKLYPKMAGNSYFKLVPRAFNMILDGVVDTYGSVAGKEYLGKFWPESLENTPLRTSRLDDAPGGVPRMAARRHDTPVLTSPFSNGSRSRHSIYIDGPGKKEGRLNVDVRSKPDVATIQLILKQALKEHEGQDSLDLVRQEVEWARKMMKKLGLGDRHISAELRSLPELEEYPEFYTVENDDMGEDYEDTPFEAEPEDPLNDGLKDKADELEDGL